MREGENALDDSVRVQSEFIQLVAKIYFHEEDIDIARLMPHFLHLSKGTRYLALYGRARGVPPGHRRDGSCPGADAAYLSGTCHLFQHCWRYGLGQLDPP